MIDKANRDAVSESVTSISSQFCIFIQVELLYVSFLKSETYALSLFPESEKNELRAQDYKVKTKWIILKTFNIFEN